MGQFGQKIGLAVLGVCVEDDRDALLRLLPPGMAWPREPDTVLADLCLGLSGEFARVRGRVVALLAEMDPGRAFELIGDWETLLGLPDDCEQPTELGDRQIAARARLRAVLGAATSAPNADYYVGLAEELGYTATVYRGAKPRYAGHYTAGDVVRAGAWNFAFIVETTSGDNDSLLECVMQRYALLGTTAVVRYS